MDTITPLSVPDHARFVVCNREGITRAWSDSEAVAQALAKRHGPGAYVAEHVPFDLEAAEREEALAELRALQGFAPRVPECSGCPECDPAEREYEAELFRAYEREMAAREAAEAALASLRWARLDTRVTQAVAEEAPAKLTVGFTQGGHLATRSRRVLRKAGITVPNPVSPAIVAEAIREAGFTPEIVDARDL